MGLSFVDGGCLCMVCLLIMCMLLSMYCGSRVGREYQDSADTKQSLCLLFSYQDKMKKRSKINFLIIISYFSFQSRNTSLSNN